MPQQEAPKEERRGSLFRNAFWVRVQHVVVLHRGSHHRSPRSECDSPFVLTNHTLDFLEQHWVDEIDFVICPFLTSSVLVLLANNSMYRDRRQRKVSRRKSLLDRADGFSLIRHDNDRNIPRTPAEIYDLNRAVASRMEKIFLHRGIPVIPSLGAPLRLAYYRSSELTLPGDR